MAFLKKLLGKKDGGEDTALNQVGDGMGGGTPVEEKKEKKEVKKETGVGGSATSLPKLSAELEKLAIQFDSFKEIRGAFTERFNRISEQIGELRAMILDRDREFGQLQAKALKTIDTVEAVKPDKISITLQKQDGKVEALKANLESNEAIMKRISEELRTLRQKLQMFSGLEEVEKMGEEVKKELIDVKKIEAVAQGHADKVEVMFVEMQKRFKELEQYNDRLNELSLDAKQRNKDIEFLRTRISEVATKDEVEKQFAKLSKQLQGADKKIEAPTKKTKLSRDLEALRGMVQQDNSK